jgi:hypothetical protein
MKLKAFMIKTTKKIKFCGYFSYNLKKTITKFIYLIKC